MTLQQPQEEFIRMPALQEQDQDLADSHAIRGQATLPGASGDEYCSEDVYEAVRNHRPIGQQRGGDQMSNQPRPPSGSASRRPRWLSSDLHLVIYFPSFFFLMDHHPDFERQLETGEIVYLHCNGVG